MPLTSDETELLRKFRKQIGQNIHQARAVQKLTLQKLAKYTGMRPEVIDGYEIGKGEIGLKEMVKISIVLGIDTAKLLPTESLL